MTEYVLFLLGILGFIVSYAVLAHLSARMGEGLRLPGYYRIYYIAILVLALAAYYGVYRTGEKGSDNVLILLLTIGNLLAIAASHKYWWWLKEELWMKNNKGDGSNE